MGADNQHLRPTVADLQAGADKIASPFDKVKMAIIGPRTDASVRSRLHVYVGIGGLVLGFYSTCVSRGWLQWAKQNQRPLYVYMDPAGNGTVVAHYPPLEQVPFREIDIKSHLWDITRLQFEVKGDTITDNEGALATYYFIGDAQRKHAKESRDENEFGSSSEKIALVRDNKERDLELRNVKWVMKPIKADDGFRGVAEVLIFARVKQKGSEAIERRRAYRVTYNFTFGASVVPGKDPQSSENFLLNNHLLVRVDGYKVDPEASGVISEKPDPDIQGEALSATGAWPDPAAAAAGGPLAKPVLPGGAPQAEENKNKNVNSK